MCSTNADSNAPFFCEAAEEEHSGYLYKSPPPGLLRNMKSWKRRFFVLAKTSDSTHELRYYTTDKRDTQINSIDVSTITTLWSTCPKSHPAHDWICKNFKCSPCSVLFMKAENPKDKVQREYFFIGENSAEADGWFNALLWVQKYDKRKSEPDAHNNSRENMNDPISTDHNSHGNEQNGIDRLPLLPPKRMSAPAEMIRNECHEPLSQSALETKLDDSTEESNEDYDLPSRKRADSTEESLLDCVTKVFDNLRTHQTSYEEEETQSKMHALIEKEMCMTVDDLNGVIFTDEAGKPCVSECRRIEDTCLLHKGDQIRAVNDLLTHTVEDILMFLRKLKKQEVKLTILRCPDSIPLHCKHSN